MRLLHLAAFLARNQVRLCERIMRTATVAAGFGNSSLGNSTHDLTSLVIPASQAGFVG
jgi:hypothetical protein